MNFAESLANALRQHHEFGPKLKEIDAQEKEVADAVQHVDLDIEYTPVCLRAGDTTKDAVPVEYKTGDGRYVIKEPYMLLTADELKVMRARYLIARGREMRPFYDRFFKSTT